MVFVSEYKPVSVSNYLLELGTFINPLLNKSFRGWQSPKLPGLPPVIIKGYHKDDSHLGYPQSKIKGMLGYGHTVTSREMGSWEYSALRDNSVESWK